jgi:hypothetical protein
MPQGWNLGIPRISREVVLDLLVGAYTDNTKKYKIKEGKVDIPQLGLGALPNPKTFKESIKSISDAR